MALAVTGMASAGCGVAFADRHGHGDGATVFGGFSAASLSQQNTAQARRQNNNCAQQNGFMGTPVLAGSRVASRCVTGDASVNKHTVSVGRGAHATGGSSNFSLFQTNTAQKGRQNNNCANLSHSDLTLTGGRVISRCISLDGSRNKGTVAKSGGAHAEAGSGLAFPTDQQNVAQEGRQNNNCHNASDTVLTLTGGRVGSHCQNVDGSRNKVTAVKGRGARATGGSSTAGSADQQNTAQEGRQNNNCALAADALLTVTGAATDSRCANADHSRNKHTVTRGGGAHAEGGSTTGNFVLEQNVAQEGRQNNNCANVNSVLPNRLNGSRAASHCTNADASRNKHTVTRGGGAHAEGGSTTAGQGFQQNVAQEGRQNNNCADNDQGSITLTGTRAHSRCATVDRSVNVGTVDRSGGAETEGGSALGNLFEQNTAQDGRQNNSCDNSNDLTLTASGSRTRTECVAFDTSRNIHSVTR